MSNWIHFSLPRFQVPGFFRCGWAGIIFCLAAAPGTSLEAQHFDCILLNDENTNIFMAPDACFTKENIDWCNCVDSALTHPVRGQASGFRQGIQWISGQPGIGNHLIEIEEGTLDLSGVSPGDLLGTGEAMELIPLGFPFVGGDFFGVEFAVTATDVDDNAVDFQVSITAVTAAVLEAIGYDPTDAEHSNGHMLTGQLRDNDGQGLVIEYRYATENYTATTVPGLLPTEASMPIFTVPFILEFFSRESGIYTLPETGDVDVTTTIRSFLEDTVADIPPLGTTDLCENLDDFTHCKIISEIVELRDTARDNNPPTAVITPIDPGIFLMLDEPVNLDTFCGRAYILLRGRNSEDGDGGYQELRYRWDIVDGTEGGAEIYENTRDFKDTHVIFTQEGIYEIRLRVDDGATGDNSSEAFVTIAVSTSLDFNAPPFVVLQTRPNPPDVRLNRRSASVVLDAAESDGGGEGCEQEITFLWRQIDDNQAIEPGLQRVAQKARNTINIDWIVIAHQDQRCLAILFAKTAHQANGFFQGDAGLKRALAGNLNYRPVRHRIGKGRADFDNVGAGGRKAAQNIKRSFYIRVAHHGKRDEAALPGFPQHRETLFDTPAHMVVSNASATVKISLSPRPHMFITMR